ncbi:MAG: large extracellular alpha-helical protein, partial [Bacteroidota bacterium]|nr:large extracellular alpha-helical protein [Bacteroidota bacterium]
VESILREPGGCFEQTSSSNYPNIMALEYLKTMKVSNPALEAKAKGLLTSGYKKLTAFETKEKGYEWFGASPPHEALTAYGLMEFVDMKQVYNGVDQNMVDRTMNLLLERRDGEGGFKKNPRALDGFGRADEDITNAYIVYALSEAAYKNMDKEMKAVYKSARNSNDPYIMALCANAFYNIGDNGKGDDMVSQLINGRNEAGFWTGKKHSITRSTGDGLKTETTSLALLAMMKSQHPDVGAITSAVKFLVGARSGYGGFGSTQATILSLKALTKYAEFSKKTDEAGTVEILINGAVAGSKDFAKGERGNIVIDGLEKFVPQGKQKIEIRFKGCRQALPYAMNVTYTTSLPQSSANCVVSLDANFSSKQVKVGETMRLSATLKNKTAEGQPMTMAIIGIPAGFSAQPWQLKEMQEKGVIDFYEIIGNNIACYYRSLAPNAQKQINLDLKAEIPGEYDAPASSAYLYYTNELKNWVGLDKVTVSR